MKAHEDLNFMKGSSEMEKGSKAPIKFQWNIRLWGLLVVTKGQSWRQSKNKSCRMKKVPFLQVNGLAGIYLTTSAQLLANYHFLGLPRANATQSTNHRSLKMYKTNLLSFSTTRSTRSPSFFINVNTWWRLLDIVTQDNITDKNDPGVWPIEVVKNTPLTYIWLSFSDDLDSHQSHITDWFHYHLYLCSAGFFKY